MPKEEFISLCRQQACSAIVIESFKTKSSMDNYLTANKRTLNGVHYLIWDEPFWLRLRTVQ
jgi:hypothetical protein